MSLYFRSVLAGFIVALLGLAVAAPGDALAQPAGEGPPFPGARTPNARVIVGPPAVVLKALYGGRTTYTDQVNCPRGCAVKLLASEVWAKEDGTPMMLLVGGAEPKDGSHATGALLGMALLQRDGNKWQVAAGSPAVDVQGAWGEPPAIGVVLAGEFGRGVVATPEISSQGVALTSWHLYLPMQGPNGLRFVKVLQLETAQDSYAACEKEDVACRRRADVQDFSSTVATEPAPDGGVTVVQNVVPATASGSPAETRRWHVAADGTVTQTAGRHPQRRDR